MPVPERLAIPCVLGWQWAGPAKYLRHIARAIGPDVDDDKERGGQIGGQATQNAQQGFNAARRASDHHDIAIFRTPYPRQSKPGPNNPMRFWRLRELATTPKS
jgi:hypothetical protein